MADTITVKQLADRAGVEARVLRRVLRSQFPREAKGKTYEWRPDDPQIELILKAVKNNQKAKEPKPVKAKAEQPAKRKQSPGEKTAKKLAKKAAKKVTKPTQPEAQEQTESAQPETAEEPTDKELAAVGSKS